MKRLLPLLLLHLVISSGTFAQVRLGLLGGIQGANVNEKNSIPGWDTATKPFYSSKSGVQIGFILDIPVGHKGFFFQPAVVYSSKGRQYLKYNDSGTAQSTDTIYYKATQSLGYMDIPLNMTYKFFFKADHKNSFFLSAGPYVSFFYKGNISTERLMETTAPKFTNETTPVTVGKGPDTYKTFDFGYNIKGGFEFGHVVLGAFHSQGLTSFYTAPYTGSFHHSVTGASLAIWLSSNPPPPAVVKDTDKDGIPDNQDLCPRQPGFAKYQGCPVPDSDHDGVNDEKDSCRTVPGLARYNGCPIPDTDGDGIDDEKDSCKTIPGVAAWHGCPVPDTDRDGVDDDQDSCKTVAGSPRYHGCPVPDRDGDSVADDEDNCPDSAGPAANHGCPIARKDLEKINYTARNILFKPSSDKLSASSGGALKDLAILLQSHPAWKLTIEGYTDNSGKPETNRLLSQQRAQAVKDWLVKSGITEDRLKAIGYGQDRPIASNKTPAGKAANRRVELKVSLE